MAQVCNRCNYKNTVSGSYCVNCGSLLTGAVATIVVAQSKYESLQQQHATLENKVRVLEDMDNIRTKQIQKLQNDATRNNEKDNHNFYDVILVDAGRNKLLVVKVVKESIGISLKEAKDYIDDIPSTLIKNTSRNEAERIKREIEATGAKVEIEWDDDGQHLLDNTYCDVFLTSAGANKLLVVKVVKESIGLSLKEAKDYVDEVPFLLKVGITKKEANMLKKEIEAAGATLEIRQHIDSKLGYVLIKTLEYQKLLSERNRILEKGYAPLGYHIEKDGQKLDDRIERNDTTPSTNGFSTAAFNFSFKGKSNASYLTKIQKKPLEITINKTEYDNLKKRANMSLWEKIKESVGLGKW